MNNSKRLLRKKYLLISAFVICLISIPSLLNANWGGQNIYISVSCVEDIGDGKIRVHFGYENPNDYVVSVYWRWSRIYFNHGSSRRTTREYVLNTFQPGVVEKAFYKDIDSDDQVDWVLRLSWWKVKRASGDINSTPCQGSHEELDIIPGYYPPEGGKEYDSKIGAELTALHTAFLSDPTVPDAPEDIFQLAGTMVLIEVVANPGEYSAMISSLGEGFDIVTSDPELNRATGWVEIGDLLSLNAIDPLHFARPVFPGVSNYIVPATGLTKSQGDFAMHSDFARLGYDIDGTGVKIGVLSNSYDSKGGASLDVENGDLPGPANINGYLTPVDVLLDNIPSQGTLSDEGRAMLQIIHDIAPGAELAFRTGYLGEQDMADGIRELAGEGVGEGNCDIIVDDLSYITEPFFTDGVVSQAIDEVVADGVTFFSSAGNFGQASYTGVFDSEPAPSTINGTAHDFNGAGDIFQSVMCEEGNFTLVLQWDDNSDPTMNTTTTDLDIFLSDDVGFALLGFNRDNVGAFPIEVVPFSVAGESVQVNIVIARASGPDVPVTFKYMLFRGGSLFQMLEYGEGSSTVVGHPNAAGAITVGAVRFDKNPTYNPTEFPVPVIMSFSSVGGTPVDGVVRAKPDFTAPNGINTTVDLGNGDWDDPIDPDTDYPNFFGTSAASPHAAGMAALIIDAKEKFDSENLLGPEGIRTLMKSTTIEKRTGGVDDYISGSGFIQAHRALMTFANPSPTVQNLILASEGGIPGEEITPFSFTLEGDFFTEETQVLFRGEPLEDGVVFVDENTIEVDHDGFIGNPVVQASNPTISPSELDGGDSNPLYFSDPVKLDVIITANSLNKKYGEANPDFTASIVVETMIDDVETIMTLEEAVINGIVLQDEADRLSTLAYDVATDATSDVGQYIIIPSISPVLDMENPQTEIDISISEKYILEFVNGNLTIDKLALKITPEDVTTVYGGMLPQTMGFLYEIEDSEVTIDEQTLGLILSGAEQEHTDALTNEIALVRGIALVNGIPMVRGIALVNGVTMIRGIALVNGVEVEVEDDGTVLVAGEPVASGATLIRGIALVNGLPFVNMTEIVRGIALVNGNEVTFDDGNMTELDGVPLAQGIPAVRGIALVNGNNNIRGIALVNGVEVIIENGVTTIDGVEVPTNGIVEINGIPVVRGIALVNSLSVARGIALVNGEEVPIENGVPTVRGIALVNGIPMVRGIALVNNLEVHVDNGEVNQVFEDGIEMTTLSIARGIALVNEVALVNGTELSDGPAMVNGIALVNDAGNGDGDDVVNMENMNFISSNEAIANSLTNIRGIALVNGIEGEDGEALKEAADFDPDAGGIVYENVSPSRGIALVNGIAYIRGIALVNSLPITSGTPVVNGSEIEDNSMGGTIIVFDATDIGDPAESISFSPMRFITGTTAGKHWIIPGTFLSNNFEITYGLGTLCIDPAPATINVTADDKVYDGTTEAVVHLSGLGVDGSDLDISHTSATFADKDVAALKLVTVHGIAIEGPDAGNYSLNPVVYPSAEISARGIDVTAVTDHRDYDGTTSSVGVPIVGQLMVEDLIAIAPIQLFDNKHFGSGKTLIPSGLAINDGNGGANYAISYVNNLTGQIDALAIDVTAVTDRKVYDGTTSSVGEPDVDDLMTGDVINTDPVQLFDNKHFGTDKTLIPGGLLIDDGNGGANYDVSYVNDLTGQIDVLAINVTAVTDLKTYDGSTSSDEEPDVDQLMTGDDIDTDPVQVFDTKHFGTGKTLTAGGLLIDDGNGGANYSVNYVNNLTGQIDALGINVTAVTDSKPYDGNNSSPGTPLVDDLMGDDYASTDPLQVFDNRNAGTGKTITASGLLIEDGNGGANYSVSYVPVHTGQIGAIAINVTAVADIKVYDGSNTSSGTPLVDPLTGGDMVSNDPVQLFDNKHVGGGKILAASGLVIDDGNGGANYAVTYVPVSTGQITALAINVTAVPDSKVYDGFNTSSGTPLVDLLMGDDYASTDPVQVFDNRNAGTGKILSASGLLINDGNGGNNYTVSYVNVASGQITALAINVTAVLDIKPYDGSNSSLGIPLVDPLISGDFASILPSQLFDNKNAGTGKTLSASGLLVNDGNGGNNYSVSYVDVYSGQIITAAINVTAVSDSKVYDGTSSSVGVPHVDLLISGDHISNDPGQLFEDKNVGTELTLIASGLLIEDGNGGNNYIVNYVNDYTGVITQKEVLVTPVEDYLYIYEREPLPQPAFYYDGWIAGDEGNVDYVARRFIDWRYYNPDEWGTGGIYVTIPTPSNTNYSYDIDKGRLVVIHVPHDDDNHSKSATVSGAAEVKELDPDYLNVYPNPVTDKVHITMKDIEHYKMIQLYDVAGRVHPITSIDKRTDNLEIDMTKLASGNYIIKILMEDSVRVVQVIKK